MRLNLILFGVLVLCALGLVTAQHQARKLFIALESEQEAARQLDVEWDQLQLDQSTWAMHSRVELIAASELAMKVLPSERARMIAVPVAPVPVPVPVPVPAPAQEPRP